MIQFLEYSAGGQRGGELFTGRLHGFLKKHYRHIIPTEYVERPPELDNPIRAALDSLKRVRETAPELVVADVSSGMRNILAVRQARRSGKNSLIIVQDQRMNYRFHGFFLIKSLVRHCERNLIKKADIIVVNSEYTASFARQWAKSEIPVIVSRPGLESFSDYVVPLIVDGSVLGSVIHLLNAGRPDERKGTKYLIEALPLLSDLDIQLHVTGGFSFDDPYCRKLYKLVERLNLTSRVTFHGYLSRAELIDLYKSCSLFIVPSLSEGYGIAMAEALAFGLPVVATRSGAIPEMIEDGVNGLLVPSKDPEALANAIRRLSADRDLRNRIRTNNQVKAKALPTWDDFDRTLQRELIPLIEQLTGLKSI